MEVALSYPEWHYRKRCYLQDYCQVVELQPDTVDSEWQPTPDTRRRIRRVRRQFEALRPQREHLRAQIDGDDFDLDALIRSQAEQRAGEPGSDRIYASTREQIRDLAVSVLIDTSLSTDAMVGERRVLDLETEALMVLAHGIEVCGDALSLCYRDPS